MLAVPAGAVNEIITFDDISLTGTRGNFADLGIDNTYRGYTWNETSPEQPWAAASQTDVQFATLGAAFDGDQFGWNWSAGLTNSVTFDTEKYVAGAWLRDLWNDESRQADTIQFRAYDNSDTLIGASSILSIGQQWQYLSAGLAGVKRLEILANGGIGDGRWYAIDALEISDTAPVVPTPGAAVFALLGLGALAIRRRRAA